MNNSNSSTPEELQAMFPDIVHALENEDFKYYLREELRVKFACTTSGRTKFYIPLTEDCVMEVRPTDILSQNVPTWYMSNMRIKRDNGDREVKKILRANIVVRRALPEDSTILFSQTMMVPNFKNLIGAGLEFANRETGVKLEFLKNRSSKTS
jgi:hypothetical protein